MNYLDEGPRDGEVVVMVHGNPSWSYYWRTLVAGLSDKYRCIPLRIHPAVARGRPRCAAEASGHHRPGDPGRARLGRHDRFRLGAVAPRAGEAPGGAQHRRVPDAGGEEDAVADRAGPPLEDR
ncbi:hypothetical protein G6F22_019839 [Rhizopus arrhizus]|nr:hypothetical protein G6F22_019839 [Rhizopus arrhizus]